MAQLNTLITDGNGFFFSNTCNSHDWLLKAVYFASKSASDSNAKNCQKQNTGYQNNKNNSQYTNQNDEE